MLADIELDPQFTHDFVIYVSVKDDSLWVKPSYLRPAPGDRGIRLESSVTVRFRICTSHSSEMKKETSLASL